MLLLWGERHVAVLALLTATACNADVLIEEHPATGGAGGSPEPGCPADLSTLSGACAVPLECRYPSACAEDGCVASCVDGQWRHDCAPCSTSKCPTAAPAHGSPCASRERGVSCHYDTCALDNGLLLATCSNGSWSVQATLCEPVCGISGKDLYMPCPRNTVCTETFCQQADICLPNPCEHEPFSCACAGSLCPANEVCVWAYAGWVNCVPPNDVIQVLAAHQDQPGPIDVDGAHVYWGSMDGGGRAARASISGSDFKSLVQLTWEPNGLAVSAGELFVVDHVAGELQVLPSSGGASTKLLTGLGYPHDVAVDDDFAYVTVMNEGRLIRVLRQGSVPQVLATGLDQPSRIAMDDTHVYWIHEGADTSVMRVSKFGGGAQVLATGLVYPWDLALDEGYAYWTENPGVRRVPKAGGPTEVVFDSPNVVRPIAVDASYVYVGQWDGPAIVRAPKSGGAVEPLAPEGNPQGIVLSAADIYWSDGCGTILRRSK